MFENTAQKVSLLGTDYLQRNPDIVENVKFGFPYMLSALQLDLYNAQTFQ